MLRIITSCMECPVNMDLRIHYGEINRYVNTRSDWLSEMGVSHFERIVCRTTRDGERETPNRHEE
jgi:hypothetical protein